MIMASFSFAQEMPKDSLIEPFKIDNRFLSGLDIPQLRLKSNPKREYYKKRIYNGSELSVDIMSSEFVSNKINNFPIDEFVYYINGKADISAKDSTTVTFYSGDYLFVPKGFSGNWTNNGGNRLHLELSVVSKQRADSSQISNAKMPFLLDRELISGIGLTKLDATSYKDTLYLGVELVVLTESETPTKKQISENPKEQFIHILNGGLTIQPENGLPQTYLKGDFFILPKGFSGSWISEGQNLLRILKVIQK